MKFNPFWKKLIKELNVGKTFLTLHKPENFSANSYYNEIIIIPYSSRKLRYIKKKSFENVWNYGLKLNPDLKFHPTYYKKIYGINIVNASYMLTLIDFYLRRFKTEWG